MAATRNPAADFCCYLVGGAVRDRLLGREGGDDDYVVVGGTPERMLDAGFRAVGSDFPVFLHPHTHEEYALARTERKSGHGYLGFVFYSAPTVTLEEDLKRRDLTINAMAMGTDGTVVDPYGGRDDLQNRVLRHVSDSFVEDPVRLLRVARFAAALPDFAVADETRRLMREMVENGEVGHLQHERVWRELARGLTASRPSRMIEVLEDCGALAVLLPEVAALKGVPERLDYHPEGEAFLHTCMVVDEVARRGGGAEVAFAALLHDVGKAETPAEVLPSHHGHEGRGERLVREVVGRLRPPKDAGRVAVLATREHGRVHGVMEMRAATVVDLLTSLDAFRRPWQLERVLEVCEADYYYLPERAGSEYPQGGFLREAWRAAKEVDGGKIAAGLLAKDAETGKIPDAIRLARIEAVRAVRRKCPGEVH